jgi:hypothetical protein
MAYQLLSNVRMPRRSSLRGVVAVGITLAFAGCSSAPEGDAVSRTESALDSVDGGSGEVLNCNVISQAPVDFQENYLPGQPGSEDLKLLKILCAAASGSPVTVELLSQGNAECSAAYDTIRIGSIPANGVVPATTTFYTEESGTCSAAGSITVAGGTPLSALLRLDGLDGLPLGITDASCGASDCAFNMTATAFKDTLNDTECGSGCFCHHEQ